MEDGEYQKLLSKLKADLVPSVSEEIGKLLLIRFGSFIDDRDPEIVKSIVAEYMDRHLDHKLSAIVDGILQSKMASNQLTAANVYIPNRMIVESAESQYMAASHPLARDFLHPKFREFCDLYDRNILPQYMHRKVWEYAFIHHHLLKAEAVRRGSRGLAFGVGTEKLPALFAAMGASITATDAIVDAQGWSNSSQYSNSLDSLYYPDVIQRDVFDSLVRYEGCDMNNISENFSGFDFCWSSCSLEHLGSLQNGIDFILNSVEKTLKVGGIACHTTELNLSSETETFETSTCVLYRKCDLEGLFEKLRSRGHVVEPLRIESGNLPLDYLVDVPPYFNNPHLKLMFASFITTSVGIVVRRGS